MKNLLKITFLFCLSFSVLSCSKEKDTPVIEKQKLLQRINLVNSLINLEYNDDNTLKKVAYPNDSVTFSYTNKQISTAKFNTKTWEFRYDVNGKIQSFSTTGESYQATYNELARSYTVEKANGEKLVLNLYQNDEIKEILVLNSQNQVTLQVDFYFDLTKKGTMVSVPTVNIHACMISLDLFQFPFLFTKNPTQLYTNNGQTYSFINTFDTDGFITNSLVANTENIDFFYFP